ncbi:hypothetical protein B0T25DRAFT_59762 [Lasiosphaeria hispida]|uniref:Uncharacterized protein n=1 Tax=Lasiosphaeria hispida TaxID=260671 RepID=A0AAJ0MKU9_9PEZI|nr:hypothetical protein B0T25DRAFT_59762 [Lasiosphaeria hispida]
MLALAVIGKLFTPFVVLSCPLQYVHVPFHLPFHWRGFLLLTLVSLSVGLFTPFVVLVHCAVYDDPDVISGSTRCWVCEYGVRFVICCPRSIG